MTEGQDEAVDGRSLESVPPRRYRLVAVGILATWTAIVLVVAVSAMPYSPIALPFRLDIGLKTTIPEGWGFFSRDPREARTLVFVRREGRWEASRVVPIARWRNLLGIRKTPRVQSVELAMLLASPEELDWIACEGPWLACVRSAGASHRRVVNESPSPMLCDSIAIVARRPVPWAWYRDTSREIEMPSSVTLLDVRCS